MSEELEQIQLVNWVHTEYGDPIWKRLHHSPNGGKRHIKTAQRLKMMGVRKGFPDLILAVPRLEWSGLVIELKIGRGRMSPDQVEWFDWLTECRFKCELCYGLQQGKDAIREYLL